jgi:hypothetical protein
MEDGFEIFGAMRYFQNREAGAVEVEDGPGGFFKDRFGENGRSCGKVDDV